MNYLPLKNELRLLTPGCDHTAVCEWRAVRQMPPPLAAHHEQPGLDTQRLASIGLHAGRIAHDFNNLLAPIVSAAQLAMIDHAPNQDLTVLLEHIITAAQRASELSRQMTRFARQEPARRARTNLSLLVGEMIPLARIALDPDVRLRFEPSPPIWLEADPTQLQQVLMNLVTNAGEAIGRRPGVISISVGTANIDERSPAPGLVELLPEGRYAFMRVSDTGCGIDTAVRGRLFEPWFTTKGSGSGLGLSTVRLIVREHGGGVSVLSEPGRGSTFTIWLPIATESASPAPPPCDTCA